jgi:predicted nucleic acid-binding protein
MYLIDTDVISELRKGPKANSNVLKFFSDADQNDHALYLSVITIGELRRGVELIRHRRDLHQAKRLESWLESLLEEYEDHILEFGREEAQVWGRLRVPHPENALDKQIAATAFTHGLKLVTRNSDHFAKLGLQILNPFASRPL